MKVKMESMVMSPKQKIIRIEIWEEKDVLTPPHGVFVRAKESYFHPGSNQIPLDVSGVVVPVARFSFPKKFSVKKEEIGKWLTEYSICPNCHTQMEYTDTDYGFGKVQGFQCPSCGKWVSTLKNQ